LRKFARTFGDRFSSMVDRTQSTVYGNLRGLLDRFGAMYLRPFDDFEYWT
jgi:hypothetical protein